MKKFVIISVILLLIGGGVFGFSLWHYIDSRSVAETVPTEAAPIADPASEQATAAASLRHSRKKSASLPERR